jgi:hypothetical protein
MTPADGPHIKLAEAFMVCRWVLAKRKDFQRDDVFNKRRLALWGDEHDGAGAAMDQFMGATFISAYREVPAHRDPSFPRWSHLLLLRTRHSLVWSEADNFGVDQQPGTIIALDVHARHGLARPDYPYSCMWSAALIDSDVRLSEVESVLRFQDTLREMKRRMREVMARTDRSAA